MKIKNITIHCSDSPHRGDTAEDVHRWHLERGWDGIGYHWVIREDGTVEAGRPEYWIGSHVQGHNTGNIGIMLFGVDYFTEDQYEALDLLLRKKLEEYPGAEVYGHHDFNPVKHCPGFNVPRWARNRGIIS